MNVRLTAQPATSATRSAPEGEAISRPTAENSIKTVFGSSKINDT